MTYEDALQQVLDSVRAGEDVEAAVARHPEHVAALREDLHLTRELARLSDAIPSVRRDAREAAWRRMQSQLGASGGSASRPWWRFGGGWLPRYAIAAVLVVVAAVAGGLTLDGGGTSVEAATIEGVVVENQGDTLTVQTLETLEWVRVPADINVIDPAGTPIELGGIEAGQVVFIDAERRGRGEIVAERVERRVDSIEAWCDGASTRCAALSAVLERARARCADSPGTCLVDPERLDGLRMRAEDSTTLEELRHACREGGEDACRELVGFCRDHAGACGVFMGGGPPEGERPVAGDRLRALNAACLEGDEEACRRLAEACRRFEGMCAQEAPFSVPEALPR